MLLITMLFKLHSINEDEQPAESYANKRENISNIKYFKNNVRLSRHREAAQSYPSIPSSHVILCAGRVLYRLQ